MMGADYPEVTNNVSMSKHIDGVNVNRPKIQATMYQMLSSCLKGKESMLVQQIVVG
jgi:hypothetical protein